MDGKITLNGSSVIYWTIPFPDTGCCGGIKKAFRINVKGSDAKGWLANLGGVVGPADPTLNPQSAFVWQAYRYDDRYLLHHPAQRQSITVEPSTGNIVATAVYDAATYWITDVPLNPGIVRLDSFPPSTPLQNGL